MRLGYVVDFADLHFGEWRPFLIFNVADAAITIGVLILLARALLIREKRPDPSENVHAGYDRARPDEFAVARQPPLVIPPVAVLFGWQSAFLLTGGLGVIWVFLWVVGTRHLRAPRAVSVAPAKAGVDWAALFSDRRTWAITGSKAMADMVWWFLLFWIPDLFSKVFGLSQ
ncbi:hypothetical protein LTR94_031299, partial [Friedmanniomyces endolithicus]